MGCRTLSSCCGLASLALASVTCPEFFTIAEKLLDALLKRRQRSLKRHFFKKKPLTLTSSESICRPKLGLNQLPSALESFQSRLLLPQSSASLSLPDTLRTY